MGHAPSGRLRFYATRIICGSSAVVDWLFQLVDVVPSLAPRPSWKVTMSGVFRDIDMAGLLHGMV